MASNVKRMTVVIPAGGPGGGMYPLTAGMPKSLIPIKTKPMLIHILEALDPEVFDRAIIVADKYFPMVKEYVDAFKTKLPVEIAYKQLFVPPTLQLIELKEILSDPFAIHFNDVITGEIDWKKAYQKFLSFKEKDAKTSGLLFVSKSYGLPIGVVKVDPNSEDYIQEFIEKPATLMNNLVNMAVAIFDKEFIKHIEKDHLSLFGETVPSAIKNGQKFIYQIHGNWHHYQRMADWIDTQAKYYKS